MSRCHIEKSTARGTVSAPPSKSYAHRLLLAAFLSGKTTTVSNIALSNDIAATIDCITALGGRVQIEGDKAIVSAGPVPTEVFLPCRESGSTLRFMIPVALSLTGRARFGGSARLFSRGIGEYEKIFASQGISYLFDEESLNVEGRLTSGSYHISGATSSQFITGLLFALPLLEGDSEIIIELPVNSRPYIDITLDVLHLAGIRAEFKENRISVPGSQRFALPDCRVEGDWSNAALLDIYNWLGGSVSLEGLNPDSKQGDKVYRELFSMLSDGFSTVDIANCIDLGPVLFSLAAVKHGAHFTGTGRLRIKESDRINDIACELEKIGATLASGDDWVEIHPASLEHILQLSGKGVCFDSHNDHRLAMSLTAIASLFGADIDGFEAVAKSYPRFFDDITKLNIVVNNG
ncbi:MAG: 3-phosphoshikimate 1-carboxyvinyltransferase [Bacteroidales bacterium]|nr:3-phosphoshikimate 1-carboxyvinyltransferase [Bacteroidales bacterium]